jgi:hypothetical protein
MSNLTARHERRRQAQHEQRVKDLAAVIAGATGQAWRSPRVLADIIIRAGYRRKRARHELRDELHLIVAAGGEEDDL